jgi:hypothetical protein
MIDGLMGLPTSKGPVVFVCRTCGVPPEHAFGAQNKAQLVYLLICPKCQKILGEWLTIQNREDELRDFATKVEIINKPASGGSDVIAKG